MRAGLFDELEALYPDSEGGAGEYSLDAAEGCVAGVHVLLTGLVPGMPVTIGVSGPHTAFKLFKLIPVPVEVNTGQKLRSEYLKNDRNESVIRRAPFYVYEALKPIYNCFIADSPTAAVAFKTPVEMVKSRETLRWQITVAQLKDVQTLDFTVDTYETRVPPASEKTHEYVNWMSFENVAKYHGLEIDTPAYYAMLGRYLRACAYSRQNVINLPLEFSLEGGLPRLETLRLDKIIAVAREAGITIFQGTALCSRAAGLADDARFDASLNWSKMTSPDDIAREFEIRAFDAFDNGREAKVNLTGEIVGTPAARKTLSVMAREIAAFVRERELNWRQCLMDEPNDALAEAYIAISDTVRPILDGIPILEPVLPTHALGGKIDIYCPSLDVYESDREYYDSLVADGARLIVYSCLTPGGKYINRMLDMQRIRQTLLFWAPSIYPNVTGFLHWGLNQYLGGDDPYQRSCVMFSERELEFHPKRAMFLPAGDFCVFYPGDNGPYITARSEAHRLGLEDLCMFEALAREEREAIARKMINGYADYETDIKKYRAVRRELIIKAGEAQKI